MVRHTFRKTERLTNKKTFDTLFANGKSFVITPFRLIWMETKSTAPAPVQLGIAVPKRSFAKAVHRNAIKRRIRESYRKNKHLLYEVLQNKKISIALMVIYLPKEALPYGEMESKMILSLQKVINQVK
jgi:ribonuclease P protein component